MKIIICLLGAAGLLALSGCATAPAQGGSTANFEGFSPEASQAYSGLQPGDYREILADPGPF